MSINNLVFRKPSHFSGQTPVHLDLEATQQVVELSDFISHPASDPYTQIVLQLDIY